MNVFFIDGPDHSILHYIDSWLKTKASFLKDIYTWNSGTPPKSHRKRSELGVVGSPPPPQKKKMLLLKGQRGGGFKYFCFSPRSLRKSSIFDQYFSTRSCQTATRSDCPLWLQQPWLQLLLSLPSLRRRKWEVTVFQSPGWWKLDPEVGTRGGFLTHDMKWKGHDVSVELNTTHGIQTNKRITNLLILGRGYCIPRDHEKLHLGFFCGMKLFNANLCFWDFLGGFVCFVHS